VAEAAGRVRQVGARSFVLSGDQWIDTAFDPDRMETVKVAFLSEDYFTLAERSPELAAAFALGPAVIALADGVAYQVVPQDSPVEPLVIPTMLPLPVETALPLQPDTPQPEATSQPTVTAGPATPDKRNPLVCGGGLLPIVLLPLGWVALQAWQRRRLP
jgi:hypothetical protein